MQTLYVPKYKLTYRVNPKNPCELQWSKKPFGPMTSWQHAYTFGKPIRALDTDDQTGQGVVVLNDSSTYVGSGVRVWGKKFYTAGSRIYSLYSIGESKMKNKLKISVHESKMTAAMARAILNGSTEGDKEDARRNLNRLYSEWVVKFKTKDGSPYTMKIVGAEDEDQAFKMALDNADRQGNGDLIDKTAPLNIDYIQKWESKVREANAIPDKTLHTVLANLKCLGKPGKAVQNYPIKRRGEIFAEMEKRGWLEPNSMNLTDKGNEEAKKWISLCQESKKSERLSDYSMEDIVNEIVKEVKQKIDDGDTGTDASDMGIEVGGAIRSWIPNIAMNIAEDVMEKLDIFGTDYDSFYAAIDKATTEAQV